MTTGPAIGNRARRNKLTLTTLGEVIMQAAKLGVRTLIPVRVVAYIPATQTVDVQLQQAIVLSNDDGESELLPQIVPNCPVAFTSGTAGTSYVHIPLAPNDPGYLMISDRSLERWRTQGVPVDPGSGQCHNLIDGVFHPQLRPDTQPLAPTPNPAGPTIEGPQIFLGQAAVSPITKATELIAALDTAIGAAITAAALITPPNGDGGTAAFTAFQTSWNLQKATINAAKGRAE